MQALLVRHLCLRVLAANILPKNCFSLYRIAEACTLPQLQSACLETALKHFPEAFRSDESAFCGLTYDQLLRILQNDCVEVSARLICKIVARK